MIQPRTWGGPSELMAASAILQCAFEIYRDGRFYERVGNGAETYHLRYTGYHYDVLKVLGLIS